MQETLFCLYNVKFGYSLLFRMETTLLHVSVCGLDKAKSLPLGCACNLYCWVYVIDNTQKQYSNCLRIFVPSHDLTLRG